MKRRTPFISWLDGGITMILGDGVMQCFPKPLDAIDPGVVGGLEKKSKFSMRRQPRVGRVAFVGAIIVQDEADLAPAPIALPQCLEQGDEEGRDPALARPLAKRPFLVTDNGLSFLARRFQRRIAGQFARVRIQYRTPTQLGLLERFHQTLKHEEAYWKRYHTPAEARESLEVFRRRDNEVRPHWALAPQSGGDVLTFATCMYTAKRSSYRSG